MFTPENYVTMSVIASCDCEAPPNEANLSSRACEAISNPTPLRLLHFVRNDNTFLLSSRACEAISSFTPLRLLHYVRNDNNAEIHLYPCHREFTKRSQVLRSRDCFTAFAMTIPSYYYREPHTPVIASWRSDLKCCTPEIASLRSQ